MARIIIISMIITIIIITIIKSLLERPAHSDLTYIFLEFAYLFYTPTHPFHHNKMSESVTLTHTSLTHTYHTQTHIHTPLQFE